MREAGQGVQIIDGSAIARITAVGYRTVLRLKSWQWRSAGGASVVLAGWELPTGVGEMGSGPMRALCVGLDEWLLISQELDSQVMRARLEPLLIAQCLALVDLTDALVAFEVQGAVARELLAKGCGLDLQQFSPGRCARTRFAQIPVTIQCLDEPMRFELLVARSYATYLRVWLIDAAMEFSPH
jgi:sarcosine oxidase, subunit gamma